MRKDLPEEFEAMLVRLAQEVEELHGQVAALTTIVTDRQATIADVRIQPWTRSNPSQEEWSELVDWVDLMTDVHGATEVPVCWPAHEGLACELQAVRHAWLEATASGLAAPSGSLSSWYQYAWWPLLQRLGDARSCRHSHRSDPLPSQTAKAMIPLGSVSTSQLTSAKPPM